jgi:radical SAM protein with 4Fe4S-binding SPASM domain
MSKIPRNLSEIREIQIEVTSFCNADCPFCINRATFASKGRLSKGLSLETLYKVVEWIADSGVKRVRFTGGEPLLRKDLFSIISRAKKLGLVTGINTNGFLVERYADQIFEYCDIVLLSVISPRAERTDTVMATPGSHSGKSRAFEVLKDHPGVWASTVLSKDVIDELEELYVYTKGLHINHWILLRPEDNTLSDKSYTFGPKELDGFLAKAWHIKEKYGETLRIGNSFPACADSSGLLKEMMNLADGAFVSEGRSKLVIDPYGNILTHYGIQQAVGKIFDNLDDVWKHPFGSNLRSAEMMPKVCQSCPMVGACHGGSRIAGKAVSGHFGAPDPLMPNSYLDQTS